MKYRILGLDISTRSTGWSVLDCIDNKMYLIDYGLITRGKLSIPPTLVKFENELNRIIELYQPDVISAEAPFAGANHLTVQRLSNFHGILLLVSEKKKLPVKYYSVMALKSKILGGVKRKNIDGTKKTGKQMKLEVQDKVIELLGKENFVKLYNDDVTDSMSAAIVYIMDNNGGE